MSTTMKSNLFIPEVIGDMISEKLIDNLVFQAITVTDTNLVGNVGDTITVPKWEYIGDATDIAENEAIDPSLLVSTTTTATIKKTGKGVSITDEAQLSAFGDPIGTGTQQLGLSIASKIDVDIISSLDTIGAEMTVGTGIIGLTADAIADALVKFGEDLLDTEPIVMFIAPSQLVEIRKDREWIPPSEIAAEIRIRGTVGSIHGVQIKVTNRVKLLAGKYNNYICRKGVVSIVLKRNVIVEVDRVIPHQRTDVYATQHYVTHLADTRKGIKLISKASATAVATAKAAVAAAEAAVAAAETATMDSIMK